MIGQQLARSIWKNLAQQHEYLQNGRLRSLQRSTVRFLLIYQNDWKSVIAHWYMAAPMDHSGNISLPRCWQNAVSTISIAAFALWGIPTCRSFSNKLFRTTMTRLLLTLLHFP